MLRSITTWHEMKLNASLYLNKSLFYIIFCSDLCIIVLFIYIYCSITMYVFFFKLKIACIVQVLSYHRIPLYIFVQIVNIYKYTKKKYFWAQEIFCISQKKIISWHKQFFALWIENVNFLDAKIKFLNQNEKSLG